MNNREKADHVLKLAGLKVEAPPIIEKGKESKNFRSPLIFKQGRTAMPGEARELANSDGFKQRCAEYKIVPTRRQAAKYIQKRGVLWNKTR